MSEDSSKSLLVITWSITSKIFRSPNAKLPWRQHEIVGPRSRMVDNRKNSFMWKRNEKMRGKEIKKTDPSESKGILEETHSGKVIRSESISSSYLIIYIWNNARNLAANIQQYATRKPHAFQTLRFTLCWRTARGAHPWQLRRFQWGVVLSRWHLLLHAFGKTPNIRPLLGHIGPHSLNVKLKLKDMMVRLHYKAIHKAKKIPASWTSVSNS